MVYPELVAFIYKNLIVRTKIRIVVFSKNKYKSAFLEPDGSYRVDKLGLGTLEFLDSKIVYLIRHGEN